MIEAPEFEAERLSNARCPECGNEEGIIDIKPTNPAAEYIGGDAKCPECNHREHPLDFGSEYKWHRMSEAERREARAREVGAELEARL